LRRGVGSSRRISGHIRKCERAIVGDFAYLAYDFIEFSKSDCPSVEGQAVGIQRGERVAGSEDDFHNYFWPGFETLRGLGGSFIQAV
jgi:hypothetical protein